VDPEAQRKDNALDEDLEERDALVQRMRERDELRTKRLEAEQGLSQQEIAELATRGTVDPLAREDDVKLMRKFARQAYLDKWEARSRRPVVLWWTRGHLTMPWVVSFSSLRPFGPI